MTQLNQKKTLTNSQPQSSQSLPHQTLITIGIKPDILKQLQRFLHPHQLVNIDKSDDLLTSIKTYKPNIILYNEDSGIKIPFDKITLPIIKSTFDYTTNVANSLGVYGYITKPVTSEQLLTEFRHLPPIEHLLLVDDDPGFVQLIKRYLQVSAPEIVVHYTYSGEEAIELLNRHAMDVVLVDLQLPEMSGTEFIKYMQHHQILKSIPIFLLTAIHIEVEDISSKLKQVSLIWSSSQHPYKWFRNIKSLVYLMSH